MFFAIHTYHDCVSEDVGTIDIHGALDDRSDASSTLSLRPPSPKDPLISCVVAHLCKGATAKEGRIAFGQRIA